MKHYLAILVLSIIAILIHGYHFAVSDQEIFIPYILRSVNPTLFPQDALFTQTSAHTSLFYPAIGFLTKFVSIEIIFLVGFLIFQFTFFLAVYRLSKIILKDGKLAYCAILPFMLPKFIGGTATSTFETFFGYRSLGILFLLYYLIYILEKRFLKSATIAGLGFLIHPLSIIPSLLLIPFSVVASKEKLKVVVKSFLVFVILTSPLLLVIQTQGTFSSSGTRDQIWYSIIKIRDEYLFASTWSTREWLAFFLYPTLIILFLKRLRQIRKLILLIVIVSLSIFLINFLILEILKFPVLAQFQLVRSISPLAYISLAITPLFLVFQNPILKIAGWVAFISLSLNLFNLFLASLVFLVPAMVFRKSDYFPSSISQKMITATFLLVVFSHLILNFHSYLNLGQKIQFPKQADDWINLQIWAKANTPIDSTFLVPPTQTGFRIFSHRPIAGDVKDGAVVMYDKSYARGWYELMTDLKNYNAFNENKFAELAGKYNFDFMVTLYNHQLKFETVYKNKSYIIYKLPRAKSPR